jgi:hypothetical protein
LKLLKPINLIQIQIDKNSAKFTIKTIGVHIRRTDHLQSIVKSPLQSFIEVMSSDLRKDPEVNFYLATDDPEVEVILVNKFPGKIMLYEKEYSRTSKKGMQAAMVDLYSLANTSKIYGSYFSSFSDLASRIGNIPLTIIRKD